VGHHGLDPPDAAASRRADVSADAGGTRRGDAGVGEVEGYRLGVNNQRFEKCSSEERLELMRDIFSKFDLNAWLAFLGIVVMIIGVIVATAVAYHVAIAQGLFRKGKLFASFAPVGSPDPWFIIYNLPRDKNDNNLVFILFFLQNVGVTTIKNIWLQFNLYPRKNLPKIETRFGKLFEDKLFPDQKAKLSSIADRDVLEFVIPTLSPQQGIIIPIPYLIEGVTGIGKIGSADFHITREGGPKLEKHVDIALALISEVEKGWTGGDNAKRAEIERFWELISKEGEGYRIRSLTAALSALFKLPFAEEYWMLYDVTLKRQSKDFSMDASIFNKTEPRILDGRQKLYVKKKTYILFLLIPALYFAIVVLLVRYFFH
jgi:hypothetical protein